MPRCMCSLRSRLRDRPRRAQRALYRYSLCRFSLCRFSLCRFSLCRFS
jgi:hypothetical protein